MSNKQRATEFTGELAGKKQQLKFFDDLNFIIGPNGVGKSQLLNEVSEMATKVGSSCAHLNCLQVPDEEVTIQADGELINKYFSSTIQSKYFGRYYTFVQQNQDKDILLIDSPETGLHISILNMIVDFTKEITKAQLFIVTHSPDVIGKYMGNAVKIE